MYKIGQTARIVTQKLNRYDNSVCHLFRANTVVVITGITSKWYHCISEKNIEQCVGREDLCPINQTKLTIN